MRGGRARNRRSQDDVLDKNEGPTICCNRVRFGGADIPRAKTKSAEYDQRLVDRFK